MATPSITAERAFGLRPGSFPFESRFADVGGSRALLSATAFTFGIPFALGIGIPVILTAAVPRFREPDLRIHGLVAVALVLTRASLLVWQGLQAHSDRMD